MAAGFVVPAELAKPVSQAGTFPALHALAQQHAERAPALLALTSLVSETADSAQVYCGQV